MESSAESSEDQLVGNMVPASERQALTFLRNVWEGLSPPINDMEVIGKWYGIIYWHGNKQHLYVGKVIARCLKPNVGTGTILESHQSICQILDFSKSRTSSLDLLK